VSEQFGPLIAPGTHATHHGVDVVAVDPDVGGYTRMCTFGSLRCPFKDNQRCQDTDCNGIVWLTVPDYVTYRLQS